MWWLKQSGTATTHFCVDIVETLAQGSFFFFEQFPVVSLRLPLDFDVYLTICTQEGKGCLELELTSETLETQHVLFWSSLYLLCIRNCLLFVDKWFDFFFTIRFELSTQSPVRNSTASRPPPENTTCTVIKLSVQKMCQQQFYRFCLKKARWLSQEHPPTDQKHTCYVN